MGNDNIHTTKLLLKKFMPITLAEMDSVKLMDRMDRKFVLSFNQLTPVLKSLCDIYRVLTINNNKVFSYLTEYFDTPELNMFADHHNGKLNRFKVRQREYIESKIKFLEVKFKSNKGRVIKNRIEKISEDQTAFTHFVLKNTPYRPENLNIVIVNRFNRFTMVDDAMHERVTVDFNLCFSDGIHDLNLDSLVIIEVKQNKTSRQNQVFKALRDNGIRPQSVSKYCLGVSMLNRYKKFNNFKRTINIVNKLSHVEISA